MAAPIIDYVKKMVRNKISMRTQVTNEGKVIRDSASEEMLQDIPIYVRQAVVDLQRDNLLPPRTIPYRAIDVKEEQVNIDGKVQYNYLKLPESFREIDEVIVDDTYYSGEDTWIYLSTKYNKDKRGRFTILRVDDDSEQEPRPRLVLYPFPTDQKEIILRYYTNGTDVGLRRIDEKYWSAVLRKVEVYLNMTDVGTANSEINEIVGQQANPRGVNSKTNRTRLNLGGYFGR